MSNSLEELYDMTAEKMLKLFNKDPGEWRLGVNRQPKGEDSISVSIVNRYPRRPKITIVLAEFGPNDEKKYQRKIHFRKSWEYAAAFQKMPELIKELIELRKLKFLNELK